LYTVYRYKTPRPYFHTFEGDDAQVGLNFADEREADIFHQTVESKLSERRSRRERRHQSGRKQATPPPASVQETAANGGFNNNNNNGNGKYAPAATPQLPPPPAVTTAAALQQQQLPRKESGGGRKGEKKRLKKEDIGMPTNFQHISHVGWDPNRGFDLENVDPNLKKFFQKAGVDEKALQDKDTRDFIYDFIGRHFTYLRLYR
jgi:hypothetical protein